MTYVGAEQDLIDLWVESRLATIATSLNKISAGLSGRIYNHFAPSTAKFPFIIFQAQQPARDVRGVGIARVMVDSQYIVKAVAAVSNLHALKAVAALIDQAMIEGIGEAVTNGFILTSIREEQFNLTEFENGNQYRHLGGRYLIQASATMLTPMTPTPYDWIIRGVTP